MPDTLAFVDTIGEVFTPLSDTFTRSVSNGWGTADAGGAWTIGSGTASDFSTTGTVGRIGITAINSGRNIVVGSGMTDVDVRAKVVVGVLATGSFVIAGLLARWVDSSNRIQVEARYNTNQTIDLIVQKQIGGAFTTLSTVTLSETHDISDVLWLRLRVQGQVAQAKMWNAAGAEPDNWHVSGFFLDQVLNAATGGAVGCRASLNTGNTNTQPVVVDFDDFSAVAATTVRLNLNDDTTWSAPYDGFDFSPPRLRRASASTMLADGEQIPASAYENRLLRLRLELHTSTVDQSATEIQKLGRELDRDHNILMWQPGTSEPVFFRTLRSDVTRLAEVPGTGTLRLFDVDLVAEPFAYGLPEVLAAQTVNNDPAAGSNGMYFDVTNPKGDVETPVFLAVPASVASSAQMVFAVRRRGTPSAPPVPIVMQAEAMTVETDTAVQSNDPVMSGSGSNYVRTTFATVTTMTGRVSISAGSGAGTWPLTPSADLRGTYRVWVRVRRSVAGDTMQLRLRNVDSSGFVNDTATAPAGTTNRRWVDLGLLTFPGGADPVTDGYSGVEIPAEDLGIRVEAARTGSGNLDIDVLLLVPADDRLCIVGPAAVSGAYLVLDSAQDMAYIRGSLAAEGGAYVRADKVPIVGRPPMVTPGVVNRITFMRDVAPTTNGDDKTSTTVVNPWYWPRYLYVRPAST